jgi:hypothetical protein
MLTSMSMSHNANRKLFPNVPRGLSSEADAGLWTLMAEGNKRVVPVHASRSCKLESSAQTLLPHRLPCMRMRIHPSTHHTPQFATPQCVNVCTYLNRPASTRNK